MLHPSRRRFFKPPPPQDSAEKPHHSAMTTLERWAHSRNDNGNRAACCWRRLCVVAVSYVDVGRYDASVLSRRQWARRRRARVVLTIPRRVLPAVDQSVVAAERAAPHDVSRRMVQFSDDFATAAPAARAASAGHVRQPIALRKVVGDPGQIEPKNTGRLSTCSGMTSSRSPVASST